jgi:tetratricopeptide (TPR) repeat protein
MFFKKRKKEVLKYEEVQSVDFEALIGEAENLIGSLSSVSGVEKVEVLNRIGNCFFQAEKFDEAIKYYEISIEENKTLGKAYTDLVKLYNIKMKEAAKDKDDQMIKSYMNKIDTLLQLSKDVMRGRI